MSLLFRLADVNEDFSLTQFKIDRSLPVEEYNIDTIFRPRHLIPAEGTLELIEWYAYFDEEREKWHQEADWYNADSTWLEYIRLDSVGSNEQFRQAMISGIDVEIENGHGYFIEMYKAGNEYMCAYCDASHFQAKPGGRYALDDRIYELDTFAVKESEIADMQARFVVGLNRKYFLGLEIPQKTGTIIIRNSADMVKKAVLARIKRCTEGFSRDERNIIRRFLQDCDTSSILESLVAEYRWSEEKAQSFLNDFVAHCDQYLTDEDFLKGALINFIGNDNDVSYKYKAELKEEFEREFAEEMQHSYDELKKLDKKQEDATSLLNDTIAKKSRVEDEMLSLQNEVDTKQQLSNEVDEQIRSKISVAKNNVADFLSEYAMFVPSSNARLPASIGGESGSYLGGRTFSDDFETINSDVVLEYLSDNLQEIGIESEKASILGAYLLAAHSKNLPLIIAGYGASALIDVLSITLYNKTSDNICQGGN